MRPPGQQGQQGQQGQLPSAALPGASALTRHFQKKFDAAQKELADLIALRNRQALTQAQEDRVEELETEVPVHEAAVESSIFMDEQRQRFTAEEERHYQLMAGMFRLMSSNLLMGIVMAIAMIFYALKRGGKFKDQSKLVKKARKILDGLEGDGVTADTKLQEIEDHLDGADASLAAADAKLSGAVPLAAPVLGAALNDMHSAAGDHVALEEKIQSLKNQLTEAREALDMVGSGSQATLSMFSRQLRKIGVIQAKLAKLEVQFKKQTAHLQSLLNTHPTDFSALIQGQLDPTVQGTLGRRIQTAEADVQQAETDLTTAQQNLARIDQQISAANRAGRSAAQYDQQLTAARAAVTQAQRNLRQAKTTLAPLKNEQKAYQRLAKLTKKSLKHTVDAEAQKAHLAAAEAAKQLAATKAAQAATPQPDLAAATTAASAALAEAQKAHTAAGNCHAAASITPNVRDNNTRDQARRDSHTAAADAAEASAIVARLAVPQAPLVAATSVAAAHLALQKAQSDHAKVVAASREVRTASGLLPVAPAQGAADPVDPAIRARVTAAITAAQQAQERASLNIVKAHGQIAKQYPQLAQAEVAKATAALAAAPASLPTAMQAAQEAERHNQDALAAYQAALAEAQAGIPYSSQASHNAADAAVQQARAACSKTVKSCAEIQAKIAAHHKAAADAAVTAITGGGATAATIAAAKQQLHNSARDARAAVVEADRQLNKFLLGGGAPAPHLLPQGDALGPHAAGAAASNDPIAGPAQNSAFSAVVLANNKAIVDAAKIQVLIAQQAQRDTRAVWTPAAAGAPVVAAPTLQNINDMQQHLAEARAALQEVQRLDAFIPAAGPNTAEKNASFQAIADANAAVQAADAALQAAQRAAAPVPVHPPHQPPPPPPGGNHPGGQQPPPGGGNNAGIPPQHQQPPPHGGGQPGVPPGQNQQNPQHPPQQHGAVAPVGGAGLGGEHKEGDDEEEAANVAGQQLPVPADVQTASDAIERATDQVGDVRDRFRQSPHPENLTAVLRAANDAVAAAAEAQRLANALDPAVTRLVTLANTAHLAASTLQVQIEQAQAQARRDYRPPAGPDSDDDSGDDDDEFDADAANADEQHQQDDGDVDADAAANNNNGNDDLDVDGGHNPARVRGSGIFHARSPVDLREVNEALLEASRVVETFRGLLEERRVRGRAAVTIQNLLRAKKLAQDKMGQLFKLVERCERANASVAGPTADILSGIREGAGRLETLFNQLKRKMPPPPSAGPGARRDRDRDGDHDRGNEQGNVQKKL